jgi:hypothetical protein
MIVMTIIGKQMKIENFIENEDGSATITFDLTDEEKELFLINGLRAAILDGLKATKGWVEEKPMKNVVTFTNGVDFYKYPYTSDDYSKYADELGEITIAVVYGVLDHPKLGYQRSVRTSIVVKTNDDGSFETLNTIYKPLSL